MPIISKPDKHLKQVDKKIKGLFNFFIMIQSSCVAFYQGDQGLPGEQGTTGERGIGEPGPKVRQLTI